MPWRRKAAYVDSRPDRKMHAAPHSADRHNDDNRVMQGKAAARHLHAVRTSDTESDGIAPSRNPPPGSRARRSTGRPVSLLELDADLRSCVPPVEVTEARQATIAATVVLSASSRVELYPRGEGHLGFLVIDGFLTRTVSLGNACSAEMLGPGDLVSPWLEDSTSFLSGALGALTHGRLAVLDAQFTARAQQWPAMSGVLVERALMRARSLAALSAIGNIVGIERRVMAFFWYLAERWGRRRDQAVEVDIPLRHQLIADMVGARRPPVSSAIAKLAREGLLRRNGNAWSLEGEPPSART